MTVATADNRSSLTPAARPRFGDAGGWLVLAWIIAGLVLAPVAALAVIAAQGSGDLWPHLIAYVLPQAVIDTALLLVGVGCIVVTVGTGMAWLVTAYDFRGRALLEWGLLLPLAMPTYIAAFAYLDVLHPIGPVQSTLRALLGLTSPHDLWFPEIRSMAGCIFLLGFVLYPYVYLSTRAMFLMQSACVLDVSRTLGQTPGGAFFRVALPLARPAIAVGTSLALMEALNDIGASEFLGVRTLTVSIYSTWVNRSSLPGAAQIALVMLALVISLVVLERRARRHQRYAAAAQRARRVMPTRLTGARGVAALGLGLLPMLIGFAVPAAYLAVQAFKRVQFAGMSRFLVAETINTVTMAAIATAATIGLALCVVYTTRLTRAPAAAAAARVASLGYAVPGTVLAIGLMMPLASIDNGIDEMTQRFLGVSTGLLLSGSGLALIYAYVVRFLAIATGGIESGLARVPHSLDYAARTLGETAGGTVRHIHIPLIRPALLAAALLVFVDCMKELSATLLLRPLNFETLATHVYAEAARGTYEDGAVAALMIVAFGLVPVVLLARMSRRPVVESARAGSSGPGSGRAASLRP